MLVHGDAITTLKALIDNKVHVDCIVTDPPYRVTSKGSNGTAGGMLITNETKSGKIFKHNDCTVSSFAPLLYELLRDGSHAYIMTNHVNLIEYLNTFTRVGFHFIKSLIWDKQNKIMGRFYMSQFEYILFFRKGKGVQIRNCSTSDILSFPNKKLKDIKGKNLHDTEKPVNLMRTLIANSTDIGDTVLDPFMGIGSTGVACKQLEREFIGIEIDERYYNIASKRITAEPIKHIKTSLYERINTKCHDVKH